MKAYKVELLVLDFENCGESDIKSILSNVRYLNSSVMNIIEKDIGTWSDDHPLNSRILQKETYNRLFNK